MADIEVFKDYVMGYLDPNSDGKITKTELMDYIVGSHRK